MYEASGKEGITFRLNSPITEEQWDAITDVDFEHTDRIWFSTKHGKKVQFIKRKKGKWILVEESIKIAAYKCSECGRNVWNDMGYDVVKDYPFCHCGADMRGEQDGRSI